MTQPAPARTGTGQSVWALGFLCFIPLPFVNILAAAIVMMAVYPKHKKKGTALARENARRAANWGATVLLVLVLCATYMLVMGLTLESTEGFFPIGWGIVGYVVLGLVHFVVTLAGVLVAGKGKVFRGAPALPFFPDRT